MTQKRDSGKLAIQGTQTQGFERLNVKPPFAGYGKARVYFERCLPKRLAPLPYQAMCEVLGTGPDPVPRPYASNIAFMQALSKGLQRTLAAEWQLNSERPVHLLTITPAEWVVSEYDPVIEIKRWRRQAYNWLDQLNVTAIAFIEAAPFINYPWEREDRGISFHLHAICYKTSPSQYRRAQAALRDRLDAKKLVAFPSVLTKPIMQNRSNVAYTSGYISKAGVHAKRIWLNPDNKAELRNAVLPRLLGLRQAEIMSFLRPQELILTSNRAAGIWRKAILEAVGPIGTQRFPDRMSDRQLETAWCQVKNMLAEQTTSANWRSILSGHSAVVINRRMR